MSIWPFRDPENATAITVKPIVHGGAPILLVCRDEEDGTWMFLTGDIFETDDAMVVALKEMVGIDPSILELADLPEGWEARREFSGGPWARIQSESA